MITKFMEESESVVLLQNRATWALCGLNIAVWYKQVNTTATIVTKHIKMASVDIKIITKWDKNV